MIIYPYNNAKNVYKSMVDKPFFKIRMKDFQHPSTYKLILKLQSITVKNIVALTSLNIEFLAMINKITKSLNQ